MDLRGRARYVLAHVLTPAPSPHPVRARPSGRSSQSARAAQRAAPVDASATIVRSTAGSRDDRLASMLMRAMPARAQRLAAMGASPGVAAPLGADRPTLQRLKSEQERGAKARLRTKAKETVALLGDNLKQHVDDHMFEGVPLDASPIDRSSPKGLHAYTDERLPGGVVVASRTGSVNAIHEITWHWAGQDAGTAKMSTMFPRWMPPRDVRTLIALKYPDTRERVVDEDELSYGEARKWIARTQGEITVSKIGNGVNTTYVPKYK